MRIRPGTGLVVDSLAVVVDLLLVLGVRDRPMAERGVSTANSLARHGRRRTSIHPMLVRLR